MAFTKATKEKAKARVALIGPPGSGKTFTALTVARALAGESGRVAVIDTENESASKYADMFSFDTQNLESFTPQSYCKAVREAEDAGYDVLIVDSLSHGWTGKDGVLAMVDNATARARSGNAFTNGWREVTPQHNQLVDALVRCKCHLIVTMRVKTDYVIEEVNGKKIPRKIGLAPVQREGLEYEFDVVGDMDIDHKLVVTKSRCFALADKVIHKPDDTIGRTLAEWLNAGVARVPKTTPAPDAAATVADSGQIGLIRELMDKLGYDDAYAKKVFKRAGINRWEDLAADKAENLIDRLGETLAEKNKTTA